MFVSGHQHSEEFGKLSVFKKVPVMKDGGFILTERCGDMRRSTGCAAVLSNVILKGKPGCGRADVWRYLSACNNKQLLGCGSSTDRCAVVT